MRSKEEKLAPLNVFVVAMLLPELTVPFKILLSLALVDGKLVDDGFGCEIIVSLMTSMLFCDTALPARACFFFFAKSYMSPKIPANVLRRFFIVSSASSTTDDCCCVRAGCACERDDPDCDDCDICESRRPSFERDGALSDV